MFISFRTCIVQLVFYDVLLSVIFQYDRQMGGLWLNRLMSNMRGNITQGIQKGGQTELPSEVQKVVSVLHSSSLTTVVLRAVEVHAVPLVHSISYKTQNIVRRASDIFTSFKPLFTNSI